MMKVAHELPNVSTLRDLGSSALYLIATLPEDEKQPEHFHYIIKAPFKVPFFLPAELVKFYCVLMCWVH